MHALVLRADEMYVEERHERVDERYCAKTPYDGPGRGDEKFQKIWAFPGANGTGKRKRRRGHPRLHPKTRCHRNPRQRGSEVRRYFHGICECRMTGSHLPRDPSPRLRCLRPFFAAWRTGGRFRNELLERAGSVVDEKGELVIRSPPETKTKINLTVVTPKN